MKAGSSKPLPPTKASDAKRVVRRLWRVEIKYKVWVEALNARDAETIGVLICATNMNDADSLVVREQKTLANVPEHWKNGLPFGIPELNEEGQSLFDDDDGITDRDTRTIMERLSPDCDPSKFVEQ